MATRTSSSLILAASILSACNSGAVSAEQGNNAGLAQANAAAGTNASAAAAPANARTGACSFSGWSTDLDPRGLNVRAGPSPAARVVGTLPPPEAHPDNETTFGATFDVVEAKDGWFRIANPRRWSQAGSGPSSLPEGWISGRYLGFQLQTDKAFAEPDPASPVVLNSWDEDGTLMQFHYRHPTECRGEWVRLTVEGRDRRERQGWVRGICGIQETTCDGVQGDFLSQEESRGWTAMD